MKLCYFDAFAGIAGDMSVGALLDAGADAEALLDGLRSLGTEATYRIEKTKRKGITATKFHVHANDPKKHRHLHHIVDLIAKSGMPEKARQTAVAIFEKLGAAEAEVHGTSIQKVHFHEVGAVDSIADICGVALGLDLLGIEEVAASPVNTGSGTANTEHGILPVPTPATAHLLRGKPVYARGPAMELTTPTGAAVLSTLAREFGPPPAMKLDAVGYGAGDRDFQEHANVLRVLIGHIESAVEATTVSVIEANIDDSTPELLGYAMDRLFASGALDVTLSPLQMKKNRPGVLLRVVARVEDRDALTGVVLAETSTLGLRIYSAERRVQARRMVEVTTPHGTVRIKVAANGGFAPEYEDCRQAAERTGKPLKEIFAEASAAYLRTQQ